MKSFTLVIIVLVSGIAPIQAQTFTEILGRPTDATVTMSVLFDQRVDVYWEYGTVPGTYAQTTATVIAAPDTTLEADLTNLLPDTRYFYRTRFKPGGSPTAFSSGSEHTFCTRRALGKTFTFAVEADPHLDTNSIPASYTLTLQNIQSKGPDFLIDLGDNFMSEKLPVINQANITARHLLYRPYFNIPCPSSPLFLVIGNHEGELGWSLNGTFNSLPVMASNTRNLYYPNPLPNSFYRGDSIPETYVGLRGNYYSWHWGDALFIVLDPFWYTTTKGGWGYTLGLTQYNWLRHELMTSSDKYKFVFCHNLVGGKTNDARGGSENADFFEMGGQNADSTWGWDTHRSGWDKPIHQLMVENKVSVFFHGHDHLYAKQDKDGIVYQEVPQPSSRNITNPLGTQYGYVTGTIIPSRGYLLVTVSDSNTKVEYIRTYLPDEQTGGHTNGQIADSYTISPAQTGVNENVSVSANNIMGQNYPNPFSGKTTIKYKVTTANQVQVKVFDIYGNEICTPVSQFQQAGDYTLSLNSKEFSFAAGVYYYRISIGNENKSMKMICIE